MDFPIAPCGARANQHIRMPEEQIWKGHSSQWKNATAHLLTVVSLGAAIWLHQTQPWGQWAYIAPGIFALASLWKWIVVRSTAYELTNERFIITKGILTKITDTLELYRVRDMQVVQPLALRLVGLENIHLFANDATTDSIILDYIPTQLKLGDKLRKAVEDCREKKRVRTLDVVNEEGTQQGDAPVA